MKPIEFVQALKENCSDSAVQGCIECFIDPPGRKPDEALLKISSWFKLLPESDQLFVAKAMQDAAHATLFGVLCVIDGARVIENGPEKSQFKLSSVRAGIESQISPNNGNLHDLLLPVF